MKYFIALFIAVIYITVSLMPNISYAGRRAVPLKQGVFLVATPELADSHFIHTVILLVSYGKQDTLGLIINRPAGIDIHQVLPGIEGPEKVSLPLYLGGPVNRNNMLSLFTSDKPPEGATSVVGNIYFSGSREVIIPLIQDKERDNKVRIYAGYAGWAHGQLEHEIMRGGWITMEANEEMVFTEEPFRIWPSIFRIPEDIIVEDFEKNPKSLSFQAKQ